MRSASLLVDRSLSHPRLVTAIMVLATAVLAMAALLPTLAPEKFPMLHSLKVDTDPENMLREDEPDRIFHRAMKKELNLHDMVVLGVVNETHPDGVFNPASLKNIYELARFARNLQWEDPENPGEKVGVIAVDMIAPSMVDNIEQGGPGEVRFEWLMPEPPQTAEAARAVREKAERIPFLRGTLVSEDGKALCLYLPLTDKHLSYRVYSALRRKIATLPGDDEYYITGLPVAEDTFGVEMFRQMAVSAPVAMFIIFLLMFFFFRKLTLILSPMIIAMVSVICTMGLLVVAGHTVHIMSSMIPIFIMPIAVLDSIHILSEFFERYQETRDRRRTMQSVMDDLFVPMLYTSLTSAAGFASLALTPIPPVQTFGLFVAFGVMLAWLLTVTFIPAYVMFLSEKRLAGFGRTPVEDEPASPLSRLLIRLGNLTFRRAKSILALTLVVIAVAVWGISRIEINDNPTRWFNRSHPIRVADRVLNEHFGGTYMAYLLFEPERGEEDAAAFARNFSETLKQQGEALKRKDYAAAPAVFREVAAILPAKPGTAATPEEVLATLLADVEKKRDAAPDETWDAWEEAALFIERAALLRRETFKDPALLRYLSGLQEYLLTVRRQDADAGPLVGKSNSVSDIVRTVHRELLSGEEKDMRIPDTPEAVAQCLIQYQNSHRPQDLWHFVTPDYGKASVWVQLKSGDNRDMARVRDAVAEYVEAHPPPQPLRHRWFGLAYLNVVWQEKMVAGMLQAFVGSFLVVFLMMALLFRSALWGFLSMIPLTVTIGLIYGAIGIVGKDYDMPVAVLSSLTLGLAVDFAIHFLARGRAFHARHGSWAAATGPVFGEPAIAISRNTIVVAVGFLPLLAAPLMPYRTVGMFIAAILAVAGVATLFILPALIRLLEPLLFPRTPRLCFTCNCGTCIITGIALVALAALNLHQFLSVGVTALTWFSVPAVVILAAVCGIMSRREKCKLDAQKKE